MDSRISPLAMLGLGEGDAKILRNAGARVTDDVLRTLVLAVHLLGHFDLMAAWVLPLFALALRRAVRGSDAAALAAGLVLAITAYTTYYYVVYEGFFILVYLGASIGAVAIVRASPSRTAPVRSSCLVRATRPCRPLVDGGVILPPASGSSR